MQKRIVAHGAGRTCGFDDESSVGPACTVHPRRPPQERAQPRSHTPISKAEHTPGGTIRLASPQCFGEVVIPKAPMHIRTLYPQLRIDLVLNDNIVDLLKKELPALLQKPAR
ncbi:LysR family transcriptional regulator [Burkholderia pseudomultivorans]|uniref:LysR family transcriptional regulator n=1 Tax=Burkholderia pseudomultivorans TaxID=1207504 RepID=A0A6P2GXV1_9BURK|nr:hypothetical protein [Burkholderia pseudomultivorans]VWB09408.1 LysR family transcriptional regulator [Burkholderia pseudomultivorans]